MIQLKNITKTYATGSFSQTALDEINISFRESEFVAILGPSGSGKTTCLNVLGGLDQYDSGDLVINGRSTKEFRNSDWDAYRNNSVGFVFQSYNLIPHLTILNNVELGMTLSGVSAKERYSKAVQVLTRVGLRDHIHKKPSQLSGGEMQRVAIARALVNDPDIILADEPTGALDTKTSLQIMELIKEIAQDKLVVMVTHNPGLAKKYANRIIEFLDGRLIADSNPYSDKNATGNYSLKRTRMNFFTALRLSGKNIATKKWRTSLTAFASSIGIIGIALILSLSNGFDQQINNFESNTLAGFPIMISQRTMEVDINSFMKQSQNSNKMENPASGVIYPYEYNKNNRIHHNTISDDYIDFLELIDASLLSGIAYVRPINLNLLRLDKEKATIVSPAAINFTAYPTNVNPREKGYLERNYTLLAGEFPTEITDLVLIVDGYNRIDATILNAIGCPSEGDRLDFYQVIGSELKLIFNNDFYVQSGDRFSIHNSDDVLRELYHSKNAVTLSITGIIRGLEDTTIETVPPGIGYSDQLAQLYIENANESEIVKAQREQDYNVLTGEPFQNPLSTGSFASLMSSGPSIMQNTNIGPTTKESMLALLGANGTPSLISLYPINFEAKTKIIEYLDSWNEDKEAEKNVIYTDLAATVANLTSGIMHAITLVLVAFAGISLVVSLMMIGIITYVSVLERTKEIGILRALGARRRDISRVFNAETFIIGACSGLLGIAIAYLLTIPVNRILANLTELNNVAQLNPAHAITLVMVSVFLTIIGGLIPARMAAKSDPVTALRSE